MKGYVPGVLIILIIVGCYFPVGRSLVSSGSSVLPGMGSGCSSPASCTTGLGGLKPVFIVERNPTHLEETERWFAVVHLCDQEERLKAAPSGIQSPRMLEPWRGRGGRTGGLLAPSEPGLVASPRTWPTRRLRGRTPGTCRLCAARGMTD